ncbi:transcription repressor NadR [uncultured Intestinimonas sp.]|uniref:transcription repressor NadR n=1 Tax=uncultured Intestinimonas sp. TaxID=1689265 RepID=UPI0025D77861|nr:transcription repressor NadR [uncultured Intestinimonas sp.]
MNAGVRRERLMKLLEEADRAVSATALAHTLSVSRQIIVGDIALLRAAGERITATPRGYVLDRSAAGELRTVACRHTTPADMARELNIMVDNGCTVVNVIVEHQVYGQLVGQLDLSNRYDVSEFIQAVEAHGARPLSDLTGGIHLHTLRCPDEGAYRRVTAALKEAGILLT